MFEFCIFFCGSKVFMNSCVFCCIRVLFVGFAASVCISVWVRKSNGFMLLHIDGCGGGGVVHSVWWFVVDFVIRISENFMSPLFPAFFAKFCSSDCRI